MCAPALGIAQAAVSGLGAIAGHQAESAAVAGRNRAKLRNFHEQNELYKREVMLDRAEYKNNMAIADIDHDRTYQAMIDQWSEYDAKLDSIFAEGDQRIEKAVIEMYENDYAGTQTGRTAARLAGQSARKLGQEKSRILHQLMMSKEQTGAAKEASYKQAKQDQYSIYEKVRFAPIHGPTPRAPELEAKPSSASLILGLGGAAISGFETWNEFKKPTIPAKGG